MHQAVNLWLFGVVLLCLILSLFVVVLRIIGRRRRQSLQSDDWTMVLTEFLFIPCAVCTLIAVSKGLGARDERLSPSQIIDASMYLSIFNIFYGLALGPLRCSLCLTLLRFASGKRMQQVIKTMVAINIVSGIACFASVMTICRPYSADWRYFYDFPEYPKEGSCFDGAVTQGLLYTFTAISSILDLAAAVVIPAIILWDSRMDRQKKIMAWLLLSLGLLATIAAVIRVPFAAYWTSKRDRVWGGLGALCCYLEVFFGIFAGCAPAIKPFCVSAVNKLKSCSSHGDDETLPTALPARVIKGKGLTNFSYNTVDLKAIHSPRGDVLEITATALQDSGSWGSKYTPTTELSDLSRYTV